MEQPLKKRFEKTKAEKSKVMLMSENADQLVSEL